LKAAKVSASSRRNPMLQTSVSIPNFASTGGWRTIGFGPSVSSSMLELTTR